MNERSDTMQTPKRHCHEPTCGALIEGARWNQDFCGEPCRRLSQNRQLKRGYKLYEVAMRWRFAKRSHQKGAKNPPNRAFGEMTALLDQFRYEDNQLKAKAKEAK
jgi:predicted nucleic acid-binding Zn ribbon protein